MRMRPQTFQCKGESMPTFDVLTLGEAQSSSVTGKQAQVLREYMGYIERVPDGHAGKLRSSSGETTNAVRRRLGSAAKALGKTLTIRKAGDAVYFWVEIGNGRRRGRRPRAAE